MARFQNTGTYAGKGQKALFGRKASLESRGVVFASSSSEWTLGDWSALFNGVTLSGGGLRTMVTAAERQLGLVWVGDLRNGTAGHVSIAAANGAKGGAATSPAKVSAVRANGKLGGRPRSVRLGDIGTGHIWYTSLGHPAGEDIIGEAGEPLLEDDHSWWNLTGTIVKNKWLWDRKGDPDDRKGNTVQQLVAFVPRNS